MHHDVEFLVSVSVSMSSSLGINLLKLFCGQLRHSQGYLTAGMLHAEGFPCLTIKAWNGRLFLIFLDVCLSAQIDVLKQASQQPSMELLHASVVTRSLCAWFDKVERCGRYLDPQDADEIMNIGNTFLMTYQGLAWASVIEKTGRWKFLPKLHVFCHLCEDMWLSQFNCRFFHCFRDEDLMGLCKRLAVRCHKGPLFEYRVLTRWLLRLASWDPKK